MNKDELKIAYDGAHQQLQDARDRQEDLATRIKELQEQYIEYGVMASLAFAQMRRISEQLGDTP